MHLRDGHAQAGQNTAAPHVGFDGDIEEISFYLRFVGRDGGGRGAGGEVRPQADVGCLGSSRPQRCRPSGRNVRAQVDRSPARIAGWRPTIFERGSAAHGKTCSPAGPGFRHYVSCRQNWPLTAPVPTVEHTGRLQKSRGMCVFDGNTPALKSQKAICVVLDMIKIGSGRNLLKRRSIKESLAKHRRRGCQPAHLVKDLRGEGVFQETNCPVLTNSYLYT